MSASNRVELGRIAGSHGVRGQVRVQYFGDGPENLLGCDEVWLGCARNDANARRFDVVSSGSGRAGEARLGLGGISDREAAQALQGLLVLADETQLEDLPEDQFYWHELIGCRVETEAGVVVGEVKEIWETGAHDVLVVVDEKGRRHLIPSAREFVPEIDLETGRIVVAELPGLIDWSDPHEQEEPKGRRRRRIRKQVRSRQGGGARRKSGEAKEDGDAQSEKAGD